MKKRINNMLACLAGCVVGSLLGLLAMLKFNAPMLAVLSAAAFPAIACWAAGIADKKQIAKISAYAGIGWILTFMLQPAVAQSATSHVRRILSLPLLGYDWHVPACFVSTILALIGVYFVPVDSTPTNKDHERQFRNDT